MPSETAFQVAQQCNFLRRWSNLDPSCDSVTEMDLTLLALVAAAFVLEGTVKGIVGLERPPTAMGVLVLVTSPVEAAAFLLVPPFVTNLLHANSGLHLGKLTKRF